MKNKGFTLVELSIVLVIIGFLISGILVAQSMVDTARAQKLLTGLEQYNAIVNNFTTVYNAFPGEAPFFQPPGLPDADYDSGPCVGTASGDEEEQVWAHISQAKMSKEDYSIWEPGYCGGSHPDDYWDSAEISAPAFTESGHWVDNYGRQTKKIPLRMRYRNDEFFHDSFQFITVTSIGHAIYLDKKLDDGIGTTGIFEGFDHGGWFNLGCEELLPLINSDPDNYPPNMLCRIVWYSKR